MSTEGHNLQIVIPCAIGNLEGRVYYSEGHGKEVGMVICPPHPLLAGNMDNNVIQALVQKISPHIPVLIFNYRAVGKSAHPEPEMPLFEYWNRLDEQGDFQEIIVDTSEVLNWSKKLFKSYHLVGYSFGAYIALKAASANVLSLTAISPPLAEHDFLGLCRFPKPTHTIYAGNDTLLTTDTLRDEFKANSQTVAEADHFFLGREQQVADIVLSVIN